MNAFCKTETSVKQKKENQNDVISKFIKGKFAYVVKSQHFAYVSQLKRLHKILKSKSDCTPLFYLRLAIHSQHSNCFVFATIW